MCQAWSTVDCTISVKKFNVPSVKKIWVFDKNWPFYKEFKVHSHLFSDEFLKKCTLQSLLKAKSTSVHFRVHFPPRSAVAHADPAPMGWRANSPCVLSHKRRTGVDLAASYSNQSCIRLTQDDLKVENVRRKRTGVDLAIKLSFFKVLVLLIIYSKFNLYICVLHCISEVIKHSISSLLIKQHKY